MNSGKNFKMRDSGGSGGTGTAGKVVQTLCSSQTILNSVKELDNLIKQIKPES